MKMQMMSGSTQPNVRRVMSSTSTIRMEPKIRSVVFGLPIRKVCSSMPNMGKPCQARPR